MGAHVTRTDVIGADVPIVTLGVSVTALTRTAAQAIGAMARCTFGGHTAGLPVRFFGETITSLTVEAGNAVGVDDTIAFAFRGACTRIVTRTRASGSTYGTCSGGVTARRLRQLCIIALGSSADRARRRWQIDTAVPTTGIKMTRVAPVTV